MTHAAAFRAFEETLARYTKPIEVGAALHELTRAVIGVKLFTMTAINMEALHVRRVFSSHEDAYPLLGTKPLILDDWFEDMRTHRKITAINTAEGMEPEFPDLALIRSMGCNSSLSVPVMAGGELLGALNCLEEEGRYPASKVLDAQQLIVPAVACFLVLRQHFTI